MFSEILQTLFIKILKSEFLEGSIYTVTWVLKSANSTHNSIFWLNKEYFWFLTLIISQLKNYSTKGI